MKNEIDPDGEIESHLLEVERLLSDNAPSLKSEISKIRWIIMEHDADCEEPIGPIYTSAKDLIDALRDNQ